MNYQIKLNLTKIDKEKLFKSEKTGAIYLDLFAVETPNNQYGDSHMVVQSTTAEERKEGKQGAILGNMKESKPQAKAETADVNDSDLPF